MSWVTNVIIAAGLLNANDENDRVPPIESINGELRKLGHGTFSRVKATASRKSLETTIHVGAFNYLSREEVLSIVRAAPWEFADSVQVFIQEQEEDLFTVHRIDAEGDAK